jgi:AcrR family transcriptional regulator
VEADPARGAGRREQNKEETRRRIISAGRRLFATLGFEATTTTAVAREAGIGAGTLYNYVRGKEDLLVVVFREDVGREWDEAFAAVDGDAALLEQLLAVFEHVSRFHELEPELSRAFFRDLHFVSPSVSAGVDEFMRGVFDRIALLLRLAQDQGRLDVDLPVRAVARNLFASWYVLMQRRHAGGSDLNDTLLRLHRSFEVALWRLVPDRTVEPRT